MINDKKNIQVTQSKIKVHYCDVMYLYARYLKKKKSRTEARYPAMSKDILGLLPILLFKISAPSHVITKSWILEIFDFQYRTLTSDQIQLILQESI